MSASLHHPKQPAATSKALLSSVVLAALVTAMGPARLGAHDLWIVPSSFVVAPGQLLRLHLRIGDQEGEPFPRSQELLVRFDASTRGGPAQTIPGIDGGNPAGFFRPMSNGIWSIAYESVANRSSLDPDSFHRYLREEGLERIIEQRRKLGEETLPGRELYSRSVKSLVRVHDGGDLATSGANGPGGEDVPVGLPLEILLGSQSASLPKSQGDGTAPLTLLLLFRAEPLAGARIHLRRIDSATELSALEPSHATTNDQGEATFRVSSGSWMAAVVHMERLPLDSSGALDAEWRSWFGTLSFELAQQAISIRYSDSLLGW